MTFQGNGSNIIYIDWQNDLVVVVRWIRQSAFNEFIGQVLSAVGSPGTALTPWPSNAVDLLVFGPHPDDLEIGLGGTHRETRRAGHRVGLCDLTAGEMGSNGTVDERLAEAEAARVVLGAAWRVNLRLPDRAIGGSSDHVRAVAALVRQARPRTVAIPYESIVIPITSPRAGC